MDFSSALANLKRTAEAGNPADSRDNRNGHDSRSPHSKRPRYEHHSSRRHYSRENAMRKALATLPHYRPTPSGPSNKHIALLFITIDDLPFEDIWKAWAQTDSTVQVSIVVHAKFPNRVQSEWLKQRLLVQPPKMGRGRHYSPPVYHSRRPEWGSIEITRAMLDLLHEGLRIGHDRQQDKRFSCNRYHVGEPSSAEIPPVDKFVFCSETCLPVTTLEETAKALFAIQNNSWVNGRNTPNNGYSRQMQFDKVDSVVPVSCIWKADQWMVLSRPHAVAIMGMDRQLPHALWQCFTQTNASDELYFPTSLSLLGIMPSSVELEKRRVTYADWSVSARNPASFVGAKELKRVAGIARKEGCLFARKFVLWCDEDDSGKSKQEEVPPGHITVAEWKQCIDDFTGQQPTTDGEMKEQHESTSSNAAT